MERNDRISRQSVSYFDPTTRTRVAGASRMYSWMAEMRVLIVFMTSALHSGEASIMYLNCMRFSTSTRHASLARKEAKEGVPNRIGTSPKKSPAL